MDWRGKKVLITGGASFIGSHLAEDLAQRGAQLRVADNLSSGKRENLAAIMDKIEFMVCDLRRWEAAERASRDCEVVFHLAADHGGRGYIAAHPADCAGNMALDGVVFATAVANRVERITFASSGCVYPTDIQEERTLLREDMVSFSRRGGAFADEEYGWAKLMGELHLRAQHRQYGVKASSVRIFTAYGPRENETHAVMALIAKAFIHQTPFEIWGDGEQSRNFTYVGDIVNGLRLACEHVEDGGAVNAGIDEFISLNQCAQAIFKLMQWRPSHGDGIRYLKDKPVGVKHRAADSSLARQRTGWESAYSLEEGLKQTVAWYQKNRNVDEVRGNLQKLLMQR